MMKKLLILMLVLGMASVANAQYIPLTLTLASPATADGSISEVFTVTATMSGLPGGEYNTALRDMAISVATGGGASYTAGTITYNTTFDGPSTPSSGGNWTAGSEIDIESQSSPYAGNVQVFSFTATATATTGTLTFDLVDATGKYFVAVTDAGNYSYKSLGTTYGPLTVVTDSTTLVPEPTTIALLGLGSLFLLRRRK